MDMARPATHRGLPCAHQFEVADMVRPITLGDRCRFQTARLSVETWQPWLSPDSRRRAFAKRLMDILSPEVSATLPPGWQDVNTLPRALAWIDARCAEGDPFAVSMRGSGDLVGCLFLHAARAEPDADRLDLRIGYVLAQDYWGVGLGSELIGGLAGWCEGAGDIQSLLGGVEQANQASARVLEKNGFRPASHQTGAATMTYERRFAGI